MSDFYVDFLICVLSKTEAFGLLSLYFDLKLKKDVFVLHVHTIGSSLQLQI